MSDDEVIRFEITDYDLDNEFNPNRSRRAKKEHQIYGIYKNYTSAAIESNSGANNIFF